MFYVYVLYSQKFDRIYIGQLSDITRRLQIHNEGFVQSTKAYKPWKIIYREKCATHKRAMNRERELKSHKGRDFIRKTVANGRVRQLPD
ncbi:MAG: GIY-YIG nuclease family protein [Candidatus Neomarinimicrobiota bacterium]